LCRAYGAELWEDDPFAVFGEVAEEMSGMSPAAYYAAPPFLRQGKPALYEIALARRWDDLKLEI
jgi:hypothetical protein